MIYKVPHNYRELKFQFGFTKPFKSLLIIMKQAVRALLLFLHQYSWIDAFTLPICFSACNYIIYISCANWGYIYLLHRDFPYGYQSGISGSLLAGVLITYACGLIQSCSSHLPDQLSRQMVDQPVAPLCKSLEYNW